MPKAKILFQLSGSIACFKACALLSALVKDGHEIEVVATASALKFVGEATLEGLTGRRVHTGTFESGRYMSHIHLVRWADIVVLAPASANTLNKMAAGIGDDLVTTLFLAHDFKKPYLVAPAMNQAMYAHPATQASLAKLSTWGVQVLETGTGALACGETGEGRMLEADEIQRAITDAMSSARSQPLVREKSVLITSGGTQEPIDGVRAITNTSTGRTGAELAERLIDRGYDVTLLHAANAILPPSSPHLHARSFTSFASLETELRNALSATSFDAVIHLAAVADYSLAEIETNGAVQAAPIKGKIDSGETLTLRLKRNPKLIDSIRGMSKNPAVKVVAFKLTRTTDRNVRVAAIENLIAHSKPDFVVHNDLDEMSATAHPFTIHGQTGGPVAATDGASHLADTLSDLISGGYP